MSRVEKKPKNIKDLSFFISLTQAHSTMEWVKITQLNYQQLFYLLLPAYA